MDPRLRGDDGEIEMSTPSNSNAGNTKEAPTEPFKRSVAVLPEGDRQEPELEVTFAAERPACRRARRGCRSPRAR